MTQHSVLLAFSAQFIATQLLPMIHANQHTYQESYNSPRSIYTNNAGQTSNTFDHVHTIDRQDQFDNFNAEDGVTAAIITVTTNCSSMLLLMLKIFGGYYRAEHWWRLREGIKTGKIIRLFKCALVWHSHRWFQRS